MTKKDFTQSHIEFRFDTDTDIQNMLASDPKGAKAILDMLKKHHDLLNQKYRVASDSLVMGHIDRAIPAHIRGEMKNTERMIELFSPPKQKAQ